MTDQTQSTRKLHRRSSFRDGRGELTSFFHGEAHKVILNHSRVRRSSSLDTGFELAFLNDDADKSEAKALLPMHDEDEKNGTSSVGGHSTALPGTATMPQAASNIIISFIGAGILGVPNAFRKSGWFLGPVSLVIISTLNVYAMLLLPQVQKILVKTNQLGSNCNIWRYWTMYYGYSWRAPG